MTQPKQHKSHAHAIKAKDIMTEVVVTVTEDTAVSDAAHLMLRDRISGLPVVDSDKKFVGVISLTSLFVLVNQAVNNDDYDFYKRLFHEKKMKVSEVMKRNIASVTPETTLDAIIRIVLTEQMYTIPVMVADKMVGVIGRHDILNAVFAF